MITLIILAVFAAGYLVGNWDLQRAETTPEDRLHEAVIRAGRLNWQIRHNGACSLPQNRW